MSKQSWRRYTPNPGDLLSGLDPWEEKAYWPWIKTGDRICVVGAGSGRDVLPFVDAGHDVVGIESSPQPAAMLRALLRERGQEHNAIDAFIEDAVLPGMFDVVIFSLNCYSYIHGSHTRVSVMRKIREHLNADGRILLSYRQRVGAWTGAALTLASLVSRVTWSDWRLEPYDTIGPATPAGALVYEHLFMPDEVEQEARDAGLRVRAHEHRFPPPLAVFGR